MPYLANLYRSALTEMPEEELPPGLAELHAADEAEASETEIPEAEESDALAEMPEGPINADNRDYVLPPAQRVLDSMEELIHHFKLISEGAKPPAGEVYQTIEAPKGELGFYLISDGSAHPYRCKIRSPSFNNLQILRKVCEGEMLSDVVAIIASLDPVMGECDR